MEELRIEIDEPLGRLTFDRPARRNAITLEMWRAIPGAIDALAKDERVRVVVLRGAGEEAFVAGADIAEFRELRHDRESARSYETATEAAFGAIESSPKPVIAMIHGACMGGGCAIALCCDLRIAATSARFSIPAAKLGVGYGYVNVQRMVRVVGSARARDLLYTGRRVDAEEALRIGLVHRVVAPADLEATVREVASGIAGNAPLTVRSMKIAIDEGLRPEAERDLRRVQVAMEACYESEDYREGYTAFLEKRPPRFRGR